MVAAWTSFSTWTDSAVASARAWAIGILSMLMFIDWTSAPRPVDIAGHTDADAVRGASGPGGDDLGDADEEFLEKIEAASGCGNAGH